MTQPLDTPLQLRSLTLTKVDLEVCDGYDEGAEGVGFNIKFGLGISNAVEHEGVFKLTMVVGLDDKGDDLTPYEGSIQAEAVFEVPDTSEGSMGLVKYNGASQLYGFIRSEIYSLTLKFPHSPLLLPVVNLTPVIDAMEDVSEDE